MKKYVLFIALVSLSFFLAAQETDTIIDSRDGQIYNIVKIGNQWWMAENLRTATYNDDTPIPEVPDSIWSNLTTGAYCWYYNDSLGFKFYGMLYNWYTVNTGKLCPTGWHVPTDAEWTTLTNYLGGEMPEAS